MNVPQPFPREPLREALRSGLPGNEVANDARGPAFTYVPASHAKALQLDYTFVEGVRGAGKSHWFAALVRPEHRNFLAQVFPQTRIKEALEISQGFGLAIDPNRAPPKAVLASLVVKRFDPAHIWQAVIASHIGVPPPFPQDGSGWEAKVCWIRDNAPSYAQSVHDIGRRLALENRKRVILFDALDRLADNWTGVRPLARSLFQVALDMVANRGIRLKLFVRPDMLTDPAIIAFPDASKLIARKADLTWQRRDLYALLFQCLANAKEQGEVFRSHCRSEFQQLIERKDRIDAWVLPARLQNDEGLQKDVFHAITGPWMGSGVGAHKRGLPYTWLPNHLMDTKDQVSPRSFFAALKSEHETVPPHDWKFALDYRGIQLGVSRASRVRVAEISGEDYPWVDPLLKALKGLTVPCDEKDVLDGWESSKTLDSLIAVPAETETNAV